MKRITCAMSAAILLVATTVATAAEKNARRADEQAIRAAVASFTAALNKGDAAAVAAHWTEDGDLVTAAGEMVKGREAIARQFGRFLAEDQPGRLQTKIVSIRFLSPEVAVEDSTGQFDPPPPGPPVHAHHTAVFVKRDGRWLIASARGSISFPPSNYEHLADLEWMTGTWLYVDKATGARVYTTARWNDNKNYILREFRIEHEGSLHTAGTTRIAWDPAAKKIKSWIFEDNGGIFTGTWTKDGKRWLVHESGALPDGAPVEATHVLTPIDENTFQFQSIDRKLNGQPEEEIGPVELKRVPPRR